MPVYAWKGETLEEYWWCTEKILRWPDGGGPNMILDDGGDATLLVHKGVEFERLGAVPSADTADSEEYAVVLATLGTIFNEDNKLWHPSLPASRASPRRPPPVCACYQMTAGTLLFPAINVNDSVTKSKFDNLYGCRHSLIDGINRATDVMIGGKVAVVCGFGDVGKGCAESLRGQGARHHHRDRPHLRVASGDAGLRGHHPRARARSCRHLRHRHRQQGHHHRRAHGMKHQAIVGNIGHFDNEIDMAGLNRMSDVVRVNVKPQVDEYVFPDGHSVIVLSEGRLLNLGNATGHPSFVMSCSFTNQVVAQIELYAHNEMYERRVHTLPKKLDEMVARCISTRWA